MQFFSSRKCFNENIIVISIALSFDILFD